MSLGFKKNLFGYNCEEVLTYINKSNSDNQKIQKNLNDIITENKVQIASLLSELEETKKNLDFYMSKYDEIKSIGDNIGKLYLVAQSNAKSIMADANTVKENAVKESYNNITAIESANAKLVEIKEKMNILTNDFNNQVAALTESLNNAKAIIDNANNSAEEINNEFNAVYDSVISND